MSDETMSMQEAAERVGVSVVTLRRKVKDSTLKPEPRRNDREPYRFQRSVLEAAGFTVAEMRDVDSVTRRWQEARQRAEELQRERDTAQSEATLLAQRLERSEADRQRLEVELGESRRAFTELLRAWNSRGGA